MKSLFLLTLILILSCQSIAQIGINLDGSSPDPSAMLDIKSTQKGFLPPRMTTQEIQSISNPAIGLVIFNLTSNCLNYYSGQVWMELCGTCTPQPTQANAGSDQTVIGDSVLLTANAPLIGSGYWRVVSGNGGILADSTNPQSVFSGNQPGNYTLRWTIYNSCGSSTDDVVISFAYGPQPPSEDILFVPYVDCTLWPNFLIENVSETGILYYTCAFIVDNQSATGANPCWGGYSTLQMDYYQDHIAALRNQGGDIIMSFGGANGIELAYASSDEYEARNAYKTVIDAYNLNSIDFDIEGFLASDPPSVLRRSRAMRLLQNEYPTLKISLTLPVMPTGLTGDGLNVVQTALAQNVDLHCVNIMAMNYGPSSIDMGDAAISAGEAVFQQLKTLYINTGMNLPDSILWRKIGITPMIGKNDVQGEVFYLDDAIDLATWAAQRKIGRLSMWSANRDHECANPTDPLYSCSHVAQQPYEFSSILGAVASGTVSMQIPGKSNQQDNRIH